MAIENSYGENYHIYSTIGESSANQCADETTAFMSDHLGDKETSDENESLSLQEDCKTIGSEVSGYATVDKEHG